MCGIVGIFDRSGRGTSDPVLLRAMAEALAHRGPDGEGYYVWPDAAPRVGLGVRRLSIIDLATGDQPIFNEDRSVAIVLNGEIYNYVELRDDLEKRGHRFRTRSDTEVVVHLYEDLGTDLFHRLRGMYAFALWDAGKERLVLAVDPVGVKPLYLTERNGRLAFASEVKALWADPSLPRRLRLEAVDTYLSFGYMIGPDTLFEGIQRLPPGHAMVVDASGSRLVKHWSPRYLDSAVRPRDEGAIAAEALELLTEAVRLQMRSDVPVGLFLSGGIDSTALLALMTRARETGVQTFTVGYRGPQGVAHDDETRQARAAAQHFGAVHRELVISAEDWWNGLKDYIYHHDEPNANESMVSLLALSGLTSRHVKVVLCGVGGDEVFCGYPAHKWKPKTGVPATVGHSRFQRDLALTIAENLYPRARRWRYIGAVLRALIEARSLSSLDPAGLLRATSYDGLASSDAIRSSLYGYALAESALAGRHKERAFTGVLRRASADDPGDFMQALMIHLWLPANGLLSLDKVTMAHSLEARVPFFDQELLAFGMRIASIVRLKTNKHVLREAMRSTLPPFALRRRKQPFGTPLHHWFDHELSDRVQEVLLDPRSLKRGLFQPASLEQIVRGHVRRHTDHTELIFRLLILELWHQVALDPRGFEPRRESQAAA